MFLNDIEVYNFYINLLNLNTLPRTTTTLFLLSYSSFKSGSYLDVRLNPRINKGWSLKKIPETIVCDTLALLFFYSTIYLTG